MNLGAIWNNLWGPRKRPYFLGCVGALVGGLIAVVVSGFIVQRFRHSANSPDEALFSAYLSVFFIWPAGLLLGSILGYLVGIISRRLMPPLG